MNKKRKTKEMKFVFDICDWHICIGASKERSHGERARNGNDNIKKFVIAFHMNHLWNVGNA